MMNQNDAVKRAEALVSKLESDYRRAVRDIDYNKKRSQEFLARANEAEVAAENISLEVDKARKYYETLSDYADLQNQILSEVSQMEEEHGLAPQEEEEVKELPKEDALVAKAPVEELSLDEPKEEVKEDSKEELKEEVKSDSISEFAPAGDLVQEDIAEAKKEQEQEEEKRKKVEEEFKKIGMEFPKEDEKVIKDEQGHEMHIIENPGTKYASRGFIIVDIPEEVKAENDNYAKKSKATIPAKEKLALLWNKIVKEVVDMTPEEETKEVKEVAEANTELKEILPMAEPVEIKPMSK